jgi:hypothetical protein
MLACSNVRNKISRMAKDSAKPSEENFRRVVLKMPADIHRRLKLYCVATEQNIEDVGAAWIADRLSSEEKKLK